MSKLIGIVAVDKNGAIGKDGGLPWHYSSDMKFFREQTMGNVCLMGRRTWHTLKKPLKGRLNVVLSTSAEIAPQPSLIVLRDKLSALSLRDYLACDIYIIGGAQIYQSFLAEIDRWIVTQVPLSVEDADTFMPANFLEGFAPTETRHLEDDLKVIFYERNQPADEDGDRM